MPGQSVLFVCLGNICRSTMAEGIFSHLIQEKGLQDQWEVDSAATSTWEIGNPPDDRAIKVMKKHDMSMDHIARQITKEDYKNFTYIFGMDKKNIKDLEKKKPKGSPSKILMLGKYDTNDDTDIIEDPYYASSEKAFETVFQQCLRSCENFLNSVTQST